jgi:iron complex transport system ATP-binding protein
VSPTSMWKSGIFFMVDAVLQAQNLTIGYAPTRQAPHVVADQISVSLDRGEFVCLLGPNGAGKSTLIRTLVGMQPPLAGFVQLAGREVSSLSAQELAQLLSVVLTDRVQVGILSVRDLVALGRYPYTDWTGRLTKDDEAIIGWAIQAATAQDLTHRNVGSLSDGERQKVMIARALAQQPEVMVLDEPTAFLDLPRRVEMMALLRNLAHETNKAILLSTHDLDLALRSADRIWLLPQGGPLQVGAPEDLILNGAFERAFQSDGVHFDAHTGAFQMNEKRGAAVALRGEGQFFYWTKRALERAGFEVCEEEVPMICWQVVVSDVGGGPSWQVQIEEDAKVYRTIYDVVAALKGVAVHKK